MKMSNLDEWMMDSMEVMKIFLLVCGGGKGYLIEETPDDPQDILNGFQDIL